MKFLSEVLPKLIGMPTEERKQYDEEIELMNYSKTGSTRLSNFVFKKGNGKAYFFTLITSRKTDTFDVTYAYYQSDFEMAKKSVYKKVVDDKFFSHTSHYEVEYLPAEIPQSLVEAYFARMLESLSRSTLALEDAKPA
jgi:hypothetical protein